MRPSSAPKMGTQASDCTFTDFYHTIPYHTLRLFGLLVLTARRRQHVSLSGIGACYELTVPVGAFVGICVHIITHSPPPCTRLRYPCCCSAWPARSGPRIHQIIRIHHDNHNNDHRTHYYQVHVHSLQTREWVSQRIHIYSLKTKRVGLSV